MDRAELEIRILEEGGGAGASASAGAPTSGAEAAATRVDSATRTSAFKPPKSATDIALEQMRREQWNAKIERERRRLDPEYDAQQRRKEQAEAERIQKQAEANRQRELREQERIQKQAELERQKLLKEQEAIRAGHAKQVQQGFAVAGHGEAGSLVEGAMTGAAGPLLALGAAMFVKKKLDDELERFHQRNEAIIRGTGAFSASAMGGDFRGAGRQGADALSWLPGLGREASAAAHALLDLEHAAEGLGERFGQWNAAIANEQANTEITRIMREMGRAQRFEQETVNLLQARQNFENKIANILDRFAPVVMDGLAKILNMLSEFFNLVDLGFQTIFEKLADVFESIAENSPVFSDIFEGIAASLRKMAEDTPQGGPDAFVNELFDSVSRLALRSAPPAFQAGRTAAPVTQPNRPGIAGV